MTKLCETKQRIAADPKNWVIALMGFVDDLRCF